MIIEPCIRKIKENGYAKVYIRILQNRKPGYIPTTFMVYQSQVDGNKIKDKYVLSQLYPVIKKYYDKVNVLNTENWTIQEVIQFLESEKEDISFTDFYKLYINKMIASDRIQASSNYTCAYNSFTKFLQLNELSFSDITTKKLNDWIDSLKHTKRSKNLYPTCLKTIFNAGLKEYNAYDRDIIRIKNLPFNSVDIPANDEPLKKAIGRGSLLKLLNADVSNAVLYKKTPLAQDVVKLMFFLAGINVADLYYMDKKCRIGNKLSYIRHKTKNKLGERGRMIITIPQPVLYLFEKYCGTERLFSFCEIINTEKNFLKVVDMGLKELSTIAAVEKVSTYTFRHSWGTIAENKCGASTELVAFCLVHASAHKVTVGYIEKNFKKVDVLNNRVLNYIFGKTRIFFPFKFKKNRK